MLSLLSHSLVLSRRSAIIVLLFVAMACISCYAQPRAGMSLEISGDAKGGYTASVNYNGEVIASPAAGEFSARFQNGSRELNVDLAKWRATAWTGDAQHLALRGVVKLEDLQTDLNIEVDYDVVSPHLVRKRIRFRQVDAHLLFYQVTNTLRPSAEPAKFWSFDQANCKGGPLHEYFPAAGYRTDRGLTVGLLTDSGNRNRWNRIIRRDNTVYIKPAPGEISDVNLTYVATPKERAKQDFDISQTFGELQVETREVGTSLPLPPLAKWTKQGTPAIATEADFTRFAIPRAPDALVTPTAMTGGHVYELSFDYRAQAAFAVRVWDADEHLNRVKDLTLFNDAVPPAEQWTHFSTRTYIPALQAKTAALVLGNIEDAAKATKGNIDVRNLRLVQVPSHVEPYHRLEMDQPEQKTIFIFASDEVPDTIRGYRLASELYLADALGFRGSDPEKVLYADTMMLTWSAEPHVSRPILAPSIFYSAAGEMYFRDSFFAVAGTQDRAVNESVFELWGANQGADGSIGTLVNANRGHIERKSNDSTPLWLLWAFKNRERFGSTLPMDKLKKASEYSLATYDPERTGICHAKFMIGQNDVMEFPQGTTDIAVNQGMWAVTLRVMKELAIPGVSDRITEDYIATAEEAYRSYYDPALKRIRPAHHVTDAIGFDEIWPEFLSLWAFHRKILTDEMVQNHLDRIPPMLPRTDAPHPELGGTVRPILIGLTNTSWGYFTDKWHPLIHDEHGARYANHAMDGIYYNGGSWLRIEICGYVAGSLHGWKPAKAAIENRLWAEINIAPDFPTSQEYLATDPANPNFGFHRVFAWNTFVFQALELAGLRQPEEDAKP